MMIDTSHIDLIDLVQRDVPLKKATSQEYCGPCPFCGGKDRFRVWPETGRYWCRQCKAKGDAIQYVQDRHKLDFRNAMEYLKLPTNKFTSPQKSFKPTKPSLAKIKYEVPALADDHWQTCAQTFANGCRDALWAPAGKQGSDFLLDRALPHGVIISADLGFNPCDLEQQWGSTKVWLPAGVVIPWYIDGRIWRINIRRLTQDKSKRYIQPKGCANGLYGADLISINCNVILVEGEFDALILWHHAATLFWGTPPLIPIATSSVSGAMSLRWITQLNLADHVFIAFDADDDGDRASQWWQEQLGSKASRLRPTHHDVTDMVLAGEDLNTWIRSVWNAEPVDTETNRGKVNEKPSEELESQT